MSKILLIAEHADGTLRKSTLQAMTLARELAAKRGGSLSVVIIGSGVAGVADQLTGYGAESHAGKQRPPYV